MIKSSLEKTIAILLVFVMVFNFSGATVYGLNNLIETKETAMNIDEYLENVREAEDDKEPEIIGEDISKREKSVKYFFASDGTTIAAIYPTAVHYEQDGKLEEIDNSLIQKKNANKKLGEDVTENVLVNNKNEFTVSFATTLEKSKFVKTTEEIKIPETKNEEKIVKTEETKETIKDMDTNEIQNVQINEIEEVEETKEIKEENTSNIKMLKEIIKKENITNIEDKEEVNEVQNVYLNEEEETEENREENNLINESEENVIDKDKIKEEEKNTNEIQDTEINKKEEDIKNNDVNEINKEESLEEKKDIIEEEIVKELTNVEIKSAKDIKPLMNISKGEYNLSFGILYSEKIEAKADFGGERDVLFSKRTSRIESDEANSEKTIEVKNIGSEILYENVFKNIDIQYTLIGNKLKENIIIKEKDYSNKEFEFVLSTGSLLAENTEEGIIIYDTVIDNIVFVISPFLMWDNNLEYSDKIEVKLEKIEEGYKLTVIPDREWLGSKNRKYPITIDPSISTSLDRSAIKDVYIYEGDNDNWTRGNAHILRAGNSKWLGPNGGNPVRSLIKFELPPLSSGDQVIKAKLAIYNYPKTSEWTPPSDQITLSVHRMTQDWSEDKNSSSYAFWDNLKNSYNHKVEDYVKYQFDFNNQDTRYPYEFDITSIAKDWYTTGNNYGLMIKDIYEQKGYTYQSDAYFVSSDTSSTYYDARPQAYIQFRNQTGVEDYLTYHEQSVGRAGTVYTNDYNGNLVLMHDDATSPGNRLPVTVSHVYNLNDKGVNIGYGYGFRLNLSQIITIEPIDGINYAKHIDGDGTAHYYKKTGSEYINEDDPSLKITLHNSGTVFRLLDRKGNSIYFQRRTISGKDYWHLYQITDSDKNSIIVTLNDGTNNTNEQFIITRVRDGAGGYIDLSYTNGLLATITDVAGRQIRYSYTNQILTRNYIFR